MSFAVREAENVYDSEAELEYALDFRYDLAGNRTHWIRQPAESEKVSETHYYEYAENGYVAADRPGPGRSVFGATQDTALCSVSVACHEDEGRTSRWLPRRR